MKEGYLASFFNGVAGKILSSVETDTEISHQHEYNGVSGLKDIFGAPAEKTPYKTEFMFFSDESETVLEASGSLTWYDARKKAREARGVMRTEYRLYYPVNDVTQICRSGDLLILAKRPDQTILAIIAAKGSSIAGQLVYLFGLSGLNEQKFIARIELDTENDKVNYTSRLILDRLGIDAFTSGDVWLEEMIHRFGDRFPQTAVFSAFARETLKGLELGRNQDSIILAWLDQEETLFRAFEKHQIQQKLSEGFSEVDDFISFSLSIQNRRKSRAGQSLEHHLAKIFEDNGILFTRTPVTENKTKPDFLFPGIEEYRNRDFDSLRLTMLAAKTTCKDRWRQILSEADRIEEKHLFTLESAISENQTQEMIDRKVQLVIPEGIRASFTPVQQKWLWNLDMFIQVVKKKQL